MLGMIKSARNVKSQHNKVKTVGFINLLYSRTNITLTWKAVSCKAFPPDVITSSLNFFQNNTPLPSCKNASKKLLCATPVIRYSLIVNCFHIFSAQMMRPA
ncbi:hypothetical protein M758_4G272700 [Ceratodon purpureus]|uniref:Uncharacterized protein n=1 Tax=Ceratodon purpureus TaxID=3225 RepID=A0A8T0ID23_CERPU|nr:hypothetical protein KC19_4G269300 [Ceratodon purpureus]KAG0621145.1 hypothetical protein M758_4G272700 [Ceratodon purpureus]